MKKQTLKIKVTFTEPVLGSSPANKEIYQDFIAAKSPTLSNGEEETQCVAEMVEKGTTVFPRDDKGLFIWDYQWKGFLKGSIGVLTELGDTKLSKWMFKRVVDNCVFINPRRIYIKEESGDNIFEANSFLERPLRAETMQGDRVALARSEQIDAGCTCEFAIDLLESSNTKSKFSSLNEEIIRSALDYGKLVGYGQWRNGSYGRFIWEEMK